HADPLACRDRGTEATNRTLMNSRNCRTASPDGAPPLLLTPKCEQHGHVVETGKRAKCIQKRFCSFGTGGNREEIVFLIRQFPARAAGEQAEAIRHDIDTYQSINGHRGPAMR